MASMSSTAFIFGVVLATSVATTLFKVRPPTALAPVDCGEVNGKDECEQVLTSNPPDVYTFCRNSNQDDPTSLKVCTFTNVNGLGYTDKTVSPTLEDTHQRCQKVGPTTTCGEVCVGLWGRGYHSTDSPNRFSYSDGVAYECSFAVPTVGDHGTTYVHTKRVCGCAELATLEPQE